MGRKKIIKYTIQLNSTQWERLNRNGALLLLKLRETFESRFHAGEDIDRGGMERGKERRKGKVPKKR